MDNINLLSFVNAIQEAQEAEQTNINIPAVILCVLVISVVCYVLHEMIYEKKRKYKHSN